MPLEPRARRPIVLGRMSERLGVRGKARDARVARFVPVDGILSEDMAVEPGRPRIGKARREVQGRRWNGAPESAARMVSPEHAERDMYPRHERERHPMGGFLSAGAFRDNHYERRPSTESMRFRTAWRHSCKRSSRLSWRARTVAMSGSQAF